MKKRTAFFIIAVTAITVTANAQKKSTAIGINAGTSILLTSSLYKPNLHFGLYAAFPSKNANDQITANVNYNSFRFKYYGEDLLTVMDIKMGYRFFPAKKVPFYFHPGLGIGLYTQGGYDPALAASIDIGYLPTIGKGNLNIFSRYTHYGIKSTLSFINVGVGYQFNIASKK